MERLILIILLGISGAVVFGQETISVNQKDAWGQKQGFWLRSLDGYYECYYKDNLLHGICKRYFPFDNPIYLDAVGEYANGEKSDTWYIFNSQGCILCRYSNFEINAEKRISENGYVWQPFIQAYKVECYPTGIIRSEGMVLFEENSWIHFEYGLWKYYDEEGNLVRTKTWEYYDENGNPLNKNLKGE